jgi:hypothetical protein
MLVRYRLYCAAISLSTCTMISSNRSGRMWSVDRDSRSRRRITLLGMHAAGGESPAAGYRCSRVPGSPVPWLRGGLSQRRSMDCIRIKCHQGEGFLYPRSDASARTSVWKEASCERITGTCWISTPGYSKKIRPVIFHLTPNLLQHENRPEVGQQVQAARRGVSKAQHRRRRRGALYSSPCRPRAGRKTYTFGNRS